MTDPQPRRHPDYAAILDDTRERRQRDQPDAGICIIVALMAAALLIPLLCTPRQHSASPVEAHRATVPYIPRFYNPPRPTNSKATR